MMLMDNKLSAILLRFPEYNTLIANQVKDNEDFESLCADYELCMNMLNSVKQESEQTHSKLAEYLEIKKELEKEILNYLKKKT
jgi:hypothetical protein